MAPILASTRSAFFHQYDYQVEPRATLYTEFYRLARSRKWKQGSNSQKFEKAWSQCFGPGIPVGCKIDKRESHIGAQYATDDVGYSSMLRALQNLDLEEGSTKRTTKALKVATKFASHYGSNDYVIEKWQALCEDCGVDLVPLSIKQCKKALRNMNINIFHLLDAKEAGRVPRRFHSREDLAVFMENHPNKRYPLSLAKQNKFLSVLLIECW